jgi:hypothetical protein
MAEMLPCLLSHLTTLNCRQLTFQIAELTHWLVQLMAAAVAFADAAPA